jgi:glycosyltransferase involved in cell wall biosynthesis
MLRKVFYFITGWILGIFFLIYFFSLALLIRVFRLRKEEDEVVAIITRSDIFPTDHGAAVKIIFTAKGISYHRRVIIITQDNNYYYTVKNGILERCNFPFLLKYLFYIPQRILRKIIEIKKIPIPESWQYSPLIDFNFKIRVLYLNLKHNISMLQCEFPIYFFTTTFSRVIFNTKSCIVEHNIEFERIKKQYPLDPKVYNLIKDWELRAINDCNIVITVSEDDRKRLINNGIKEDKICVIPHGVDLESFNLCKNNMRLEEKKRLKENLGISENELVFVFHGVLCYKPNYDAVKIIKTELIHRLIKKGLERFKFLVIGRYLPLEFSDKKIIFTGAVESLPSYLLLSDITVVPLLSGGGTRLKILEYFAASIPVVCTTKACEGLNVKNGEEVLIANDYDKMVDGIIKLISDKKFAELIGKKGNNFVQELDWKSIGKRYIELYSKILKT